MENITDWYEILKLKPVAEYLASRNGYTLDNLPDYPQAGTIIQLSKAYWYKMARDIEAIIDSIES